MKHITWILLTIVLHVRSSHGGCPSATFKFYNNTIKAPYNFIDSSVGNIGSLETCPYTGRPYVYLPCYPNSSWGTEPYAVPCLKPPDQKEQTTTALVFSSMPSITNPYSSMSIDEVAKLSLETSNDVSNVMSYLNQDNLAFKTSADVASAVNIIDRVASNDRTTSDPAHAELYSIASKILSSRSLKEAQKTNRSAVRLLSMLEAFSQSLKSNQSEENFVQDNLAVSIVNMPTNRSKSIIGFAFDSTTNRPSPIISTETQTHFTTITLDSEVLAQQNRLAFSVFAHQNSLFKDDSYRVLTRVISLTIDKPQLIKPLTNFVKINFQLEENLNVTEQNLTCAYWHIFENNMTAQWATDGCRLIEIKGRTVRCECNHLTHFAVLMDIEQSPTTKAVEQFLSMITLGGLMLSSVGLCLTILTFVLFKKLRRHFSQKSLLLLSINLLFVNILFSITIFYQLTHLPCTIIASLLHYFVLSTFSWMFIMALIQYLLFVKVFPRSISAFTRKAAVFAQFVPLIPVIVVLSLDPLNYNRRKDGICWMPPGLPLYLSFILPIALYILANSILFTIVAHSLLCGKTGQQLRSTQVAESQRLSRFLVALSCFVVLGLSWVVGFFTVGPVRLLFQVLFCIFASLTGFLIFILYIVTSRAKRTCWSNALKSVGIPSIYSHTMSTSSALGVSKEFSTSSTTDQPKVPSRLLQFSSQPQHFIDAYMPSSPPAPAPPLPLPPPFLIEGDDPLTATTLANSFYEPDHMWIPQMNYIREVNQQTTSLDDYSLFYASNHDATKL